MRCLFEITCIFKTIFPAKCSFALLYLCSFGIYIRQKKTIDKKGQNEKRDLREKWIPQAAGCKEQQQKKYVKWWKPEKKSQTNKRNATGFVCGK